MFLFKFGFIGVAVNVPPHHNTQMHSKSNSPTEVTLEQSPSGKWSVPKPQKRLLKPWHRLWIITGIVHLMVLAGIFQILMPNQESIERKMVFSVTEEVRRFDGMAFAGESPRKIFEVARSKGYSDWIKLVRSNYRIGNEGNPGFDKIETNYREAVSDLPVKQAIGVLICFVIWVMPMGVLYAIGFTFERIKRGVSAFQK
jgi:hypothetical protein